MTTKIITEERHHCFACKFHYWENMAVPDAAQCCTKMEYRDIPKLDTRDKCFPDWCPLLDKATCEEDKKIADKTRSLWNEAPDRS